MWSVFFLEVLNNRNRVCLNFRNSLLGQGHSEWCVCFYLYIYVCVCVPASLQLVPWFSVPGVLNWNHYRSRRKIKRWISMKLWSSVDSRKSSRTPVLKWLMVSLETYAQARELFMISQTMVSLVWSRGRDRFRRNYFDVLNRARLLFPAYTS